MRLPIPGPRDVLRVTEQGWSALEEVISMVPRLGAVLTDVEQIVAQARQVVAAVDLTRARADAVVVHTERVVETAEALVGGAGLLTARAERLLDAFEPALATLQPTLQTLADSTSEKEVDALVALVDLTPQLVKHLDEDIVPILGTMNSVAPDLRDLLDVSRELNELIGSLPGLGRVKKKIEEQQEDEDRAREA
ncbi:MAG: hypothetical protein Q7T56_02100 [Nocardioidaceae bacterium]|nr:hypothetical protein [Nocardioidaceae bacterium]